jgi:hypothetical protein
MKNKGIDSILDKLYSVTKTPLSEYSYSDEIIDDILQGSNLAGDDLTTHKKVVSFLLKLFDTPADLKGAGLVCHFTDPLLDSFFKLAKLSKSEKDDVNQRIDVWFNCLKSLSDKRAYFRDVAGVDSQLFRFHIEASDLKNPRRYADRIHREQSAGPSPLYCRYAPIVHVRIREFMKKAFLKEKPEETIYKHICSARMFFNFLQPSLKYAAKHPVKIPEYYINNFVEEYDRRVNVRSSKAEQIEGETYWSLSERAAEYKKLFCTLMKNDYEPLAREIDAIPTLLEYQTEDYDATSTVEGPVECYGKSNQEDIPDSVKTVTYSLLPPEESDNQKIYGIEAPLQEEYLYDPRDDEKEVVKYQPTIKRAWSEFVNLKKFYFFWDSSFLNLYSYARLYEVIKANFNEKAQSAENAICAFLIMLIHTGIRPLYLLETQIKSKIKDVQQPLPVMAREDEHFELIINLPIPDRRITENIGCLRTYKHVSLPIFYFMRPYINNMFSPGKKYFFSFMDKAGREIRIDMTMIRAFLKKTIDEPFALRISPELIANSFFSLYSVRYGMDPIVACYVSKNHYGIFNAPLHYIFVPKRHFFEEYKESSVRVHKAIEENIKRMTENMDIYTPVSLEPHNVSKKAVDESGYGSSQIPKVSTWFAFVDDLKRRTKSYGSERLYQRHNLYSIYLYFALMLSTSLRPRNDPDIGWDSYNDKLGIMILSDKLSPRFYEERVVPVVEITGKLIDNLRRNFRKFKTIVDDYHVPGFSRFQPANLFFFLDKDFNTVAFKLKEIKRILAEEFISFPLPLNTPRHYIRSTFYWEDIYYELASTFMGHQTAGKEWLVDFSSVDFSELVGIFKEEVDSMLEKLGFEIIPYLPNLR